MSTTLGNQYQNTYISGADFEPTGISLPVGSTAVTPTTGDNSSKIATTAFVNTLQTVISNLTYSQINGKPTTKAV